MPVINCDSRPQVIYRAGAGAGLIVNTDTANPVYIGLDRGLSGLSDQLPAQASIAVSGDRDVWASTLAQSVTVRLQAMPGATEWDNPVGVQIALNALGLAKDSSVQATTTAVGGLPAGIAGSALPTNIGTAAVAAGVAKDTSVQAGTAAIGGLPAGIAGSALPTNIGTAAVAAGLAKDTSVAGVTTAVGGLPAGIAGSALPTNIGTAAVAAGLAKDTSVAGLAASIPANIAGTGVPLLAGSSVLASPGVQTFTAGQARTYGPYSIPQISYEIAVSVKASTGELVEPCMELTLTWSDAASGQIVATENWYLAAASGSANVYSGVGRVKGDTLQITQTWGGSQTSGSCQIVIATSSRIYIRDDFRSVIFAGIETVNNGGWDLPGGIVLSTAPTVGTSAVTRSMPLYCGATMIYAMAASAATVTIQNVCQANARSLPISIVATYSLAAGVPLYEDLILPRGNCIASMVSASGSQVIDLVITVREQET